MVVAVFDDSALIISSDNSIEVITSNKFVFADLNSSNSVVAQGVTPPEDYANHKYTYDADSDPQWSANPAYLTPEQSAARHEEFMNNPALIVEEPAE